MADSHETQIDDDAYDTEPHTWSAPIVQTLPLTAGPSTTNPKAPSAPASTSALEPA